MAIAKKVVAVAGTATVLLLVVGVLPPRSRGGAAHGHALLLQRPSTWEQLSSLQAAERRQRQSMLAAEAAGFSRHNERDPQHYRQSYQLEQALSDFQSRVNLSRAQMVLKDWGVPWASPVAQGYPGEDVLGGPYVPNDDTADVLETEDKKKLSTEGRWPYVKYYGQPTNFMHGNDLDSGYYSYQDGYEGSEFDTLPGSYGDFLDEFDN